MEIEIITKITYIFFIYLILAILIERAIEILVAIYNYFEFKFKWYEYWNRKAKTYQDRFDRLYGYQGKDAGKTQKLFNWLLWKVIVEKPYEGGKDVISADLIRLNYLRIGTSVTAFILSLLLVLSQAQLVFAQQYDLDLIKFVEKAIPEVGRLAAVTRNALVRILLTAVAISIGTEPLHQLIRRVEKIAESKGGARPGGAK